MESKFLNIVLLTSFVTESDFNLYELNVKLKSSPRPSGTPLHEGNEESSPRPSGTPLHEGNVE